MHLSQYPQAIANLQSQLFDLELQLEQTQAMLKQIESEIDLNIAFNKELRNDSQRKAAKQQQLDEHLHYWEQQEILSQTKAKREQVHIELGLRRNEFSVIKLERREAIAKLELQAAS